MNTVMLFLLYVLLYLESFSGVDGEKYENLLLDTIFEDYDIRSRPVKDYHSAIEVNFSIYFQQILQVDEKHQMITTNIWRSLVWKDEFLNWNPESYGNISQVPKLVTNFMK